MALWAMCEGRVVLFFVVLLFLLTESIWLSGLCVKEGSFYSLLSCCFCSLKAYGSLAMCEGKKHFILLFVLLYLIWSFCEPPVIQSLWYHI